MPLAQPEQIGAVMALDPPPRTLAELERMVCDGLPRMALTACMARLGVQESERRRMRRRIVPDSTLSRRRERLNARESARLERLARVYAVTLYVWGDEACARAFLQRPHPLLEGRAPLDAALTELGARRVETLLAQLCLGVHA